MSDRPTPKFTGVDTFNDSKGRYTFRYPSDWFQYALRDNMDGVQFSPQGQNPQTWFATWIVDLKERVVAEDLPVLRKGLERGLAQLSEYTSELVQDDVLGNLIKFERVFTFRDGTVTRKWRQWVMYVDHWQLVVTYQGETPEEYDYWYAMVNHSFLSFRIPDALWFAVDRDLAGVNRANQPATSPIEALEEASDDTDLEGDEGDEGDEDGKEEQK